LLDHIVRLSSIPDMVAGMTTTRQRTYPEPVVKRLYALSGNRCAFPGCETRLTDQVASGEPPTNLGKIAHIVGLGRQGPRADPTIPTKDLNRVENLLLLCGVHHDLVDANPRIFSVEVLATYKANHEARIERASTPPQPTLTAETVDLSLLPITHLPERVWRAASWPGGPSTQAGSDRPAGRRRAAGRLATPTAVAAGGPATYLPWSGRDGWTQASEPMEAGFANASTSSWTTR
jgi:hypothetical protein